MTGVRPALRLVLLLGAALASVTLSARQVAPLPDLVLLVVVAGALLSGPGGGVLLGLAAGWVVDLLPPGSQVLGTSALMYAGAGALAGLARREGETSLAWVGSTCVACAVLLQLARAAMALSVNAPVAWGQSALRLVMTAVVGILVVPLLVRLDHVLVRRRLA